MEHLYYDKHGEPITDVLLFAKLFEDLEYRRVAEDRVNECICGLRIRYERGHARIDYAYSSTW